MTSFDAATGKKVHSAPMSVPGYTLVIAGFDQVSGLGWGVGSIGSANFDFITVNVTSGKVDKVATNIPFGSLSECEGAAVPAPSAYYGKTGNRALPGNGEQAVGSATVAATASGAVYFVSQNDSTNADELVRFDIGAKTWSTPVPWAAGLIWSVGSWYPMKAQDGEGLVAAHPDLVATGAVPDQGLILADGKNDTVNLLSVDSTSGNVTVLLTLDKHYSAEQSSFAFDVTTGTAYAVIQGPASLVTYSVAVFNLTASPATAHYAHIPDSFSAQYGIASAAIFHQ